MKAFLFCGVFFLVSGCCFAQRSPNAKPVANVFNIKTYGAVADGKTVNTAAVQKAIDDCFAAGGGQVTVPRGRFVTGPITLKTGVELHLQKGGDLLGSINRLDYGKEEAKALISANSQRNISVTGKGEIDGRGAEVVADLFRLLRVGNLNDANWKVKYPREAARPKIIFFEACSNVTVKGVSIRNSAAWVQDYRRCNGLTIDSVNVQSTAYWNNDGIDIVDSKNVSITHCNVNASDDAICLKSEGGVPDSCVNVYVADCLLRSSASAFKIGTGSTGGFRNVQVKNLRVYDTYRSAIALEAVDGGFLENVEIENIKATNTGNAIFIRLGHRNKSDAFSTVKNVVIRNVYAEVPAGKPDAGYPLEGPGLKYPPGIKPAANGIVQSVSPWNNSGTDSTAIPYPHNVFPSSVTGLPGHPVENVRLENIEIVYAGGADKRTAFFPVDSLLKITEAEASYPEFSMFGELPVWGFYARHVDGLKMKNVNLRFKKDDFRTAMIFDDVKGLAMHKVAVPTAMEAPLIILNNGVRPALQDIKLPVEQSKGIRIQ